MKTKPTSHTQRNRLRRTPLRGLAQREDGGLRAAVPEQERVASYDSSCDEPIPATVRMMTREDVARAELTGVLCELGGDEVRVLTRIAQRLKVGKGLYGPLDLARDPRAFRSKEAREEVEDALVYLACAWLKAEEVA
jgi:hypothetical protein